jgi:hypothetical protein
MKPQLKMRITRAPSVDEIGALLRSAINLEKLTPFSNEQKTLEKTFSDRPCPLRARRKKTLKHPKS